MNFSEFVILFTWDRPLGHSPHPRGLILSLQAQHLSRPSFTKKMDVFYDHIHYALLSLEVCHELKADLLFLTCSKNRSLLGEEQVSYILSSQEWKAGTLSMFVCLCLEVAACSPVGGSALLS